MNTLIKPAPAISTFSITSEFGNAAISALAMSRGGLRSGLANCIGQITGVIAVRGLLGTLDENCRADMIGRNLAQSLRE